LRDLDDALGSFSKGWNFFFKVVGTVTSVAVDGKPSTRLV
jgi:hypothetical protein